MLRPFSLRRAPQLFRVVMAVASMLAVGMLISSSPAIAVDPVKTTAGQDPSAEAEGDSAAQVESQTVEQSQAAETAQRDRARAPADAGRRGRARGDAIERGAPNERGETRQRERDTDPRQPGDGARIQILPDDEVNPALRPPRGDRFRWMLGVHVTYGQVGARITSVVPQSPAWRRGLEPRDVIVTIDGYQVGRVRHQLYDIESELQRRASRGGHVRLLVHNHRNGELVNVDVQLARTTGRFPDQRIEAAEQGAVEGFGIENEAGEAENRLRDGGSRSRDADNRLRDSAPPVE